MTRKCDLEHDELVEYYEHQEFLRKYFNMLMSIAVAAIVIGALHVIEGLAIEGLTAIFERSTETLATQQLCFVILETAFLMLYLYAIYHAIMMILFNYEEDINRFGERWKAFKIFERKNDELEGDL